jgi:hypothetical protein
LGEKKKKEKSRRTKTENSLGVKDYIFLVLVAVGMSCQVGTERDTGLPEANLDEGWRGR